MGNRSAEPAGNGLSSLMTVTPFTGYRTRLTDPLIFIDDCRLTIQEWHAVPINQLTLKGQKTDLTVLLSKDILRSAYGFSGKYPQNQ